MSKRVSPAERLRVQIGEVFAGGQDLARAIEEVARLGAPLLLQCAVEAEVAAFLGRNRYARLAMSPMPARGAACGNELKRRMFGERAPLEVRHMGRSRLARQVAMAARSSRGCRHRRRWPPGRCSQVLCQATCGTGRVLGQVQEIIQVGDQHSAGLYRPQYHGQAWHPTLVTAQPTPNVAPETNVCGNGHGRRQLAGTQQDQSCSRGVARSHQLMVSPSVAI